MVLSAQPMGSTSVMSYLGNIASAVSILANNKKIKPILLLCYPLIFVHMINTKVSILNRATKRF